MCLYHCSHRNQRHSPVVILDKPEISISIVSVYTDYNQHVHSVRIKCTKQAVTVYWVFKHYLLFYSWEDNLDRRNAVKPVQTRQIGITWTLVIKFQVHQSHHNVPHMALCGQKESCCVRTLSLKLNWQPQNKHTVYPIHTSCYWVLNDTHVCVCLFTIDCRFSKHTQLQKPSSAIKTI